MRVCLPQPWLICSLNWGCQEKEIWVYNFDPGREFGVVWLSWALQLWVLGAPCGQ